MALLSAVPMADQTVQQLVAQMAPQMESLLVAQMVLQRAAQSGLKAAWLADHWVDRKARASADQTANKWVGQLET